MLKFINFIFKTISTLVILLAGFIIIAIIFINPNNYKNNIEYYFEKITNYKLNINGTIQFSLSTSINIYITDIAINKKFNNLSMFPEKLLTAKKISILINPFKSLLNIRPVMSTLEFEDLDINIFRNINKKMNTDELIQNLISNLTLKSILFDNIILKNSIVNINDQFTNETIQIKPLNLLLKKYNNININASAINILKNQFILNISEGQAKINWGSKNLEINNCNIKHNKIQYNLISKINYAGDQIAGNASLQLLANNIFIDTNFMLDKTQLDLNPISFKIGSGQISGKVNFSIKASNKAMPENNTDIHNIINFFRKSQATGSLSGGNIIIKPTLVIKNIDLRLESKSPGIFEINKGFFNLGKANVTLGLKTDLTKDLKLIINLLAKDLDIPAINTMFSRGVGIISIKANTILGNYDSIINNLSGNLDLLVADGSLVGFDFYDILNKYESYLNELFNILQKEPTQDLKLLLTRKPMPNNINITDQNAISNFAVLRLKSILKNGVDNKSELTLKHQQYSIDSLGSIDLTKNYINYNASSKLVFVPSKFIQEVPQYMQVFPLQINISGLINKVSFAIINSQEYLLSALQKLQTIVLRKSELNPTITPMEESTKSTATPENR